MRRPARAELHTNRLYAVVSQFHDDISSVMQATRDDPPCSEEYCRLFNALVDQARRLPPCPVGRRAEGAWLQTLRMPSPCGPLARPPGMSVLLSKVGHLKAFLKSEESIRAQNWSGPLILIIGGAAGLTCLGMCLARLGALL